MELQCDVCRGGSFSEGVGGQLVCDDCGTQKVWLSQLEDHEHDIRTLARVNGRLMRMSGPTRKRRRHAGM
jgi:hypothetical protein